MDRSERMLRLEFTRVMIKLLGDCLLLRFVNLEFASLPDLSETNQHPIAEFQASVSGNLKDLERV